MSIVWRDFVTCHTTALLASAELTQLPFGVKLSMFIIKEDNFVSVALLGLHKFLVIQNYPMHTLFITCKLSVPYYSVTMQSVILSENRLEYLHEHL